VSNYKTGSEIQIESKRRHFSSRSSSRFNFKLKPNTNGQWINYETESD